MNKAALVDEVRKLLARGATRVAAGAVARKILGPDVRIRGALIQIGGDKIGRRLALSLVCGIGRDRLNSQKRKQPLDALIEITINTIENCVEFFHPTRSLAVSQNNNTR